MKLPILAALLAAPLGAVTFTRDVAPILFKYCAPCHRPGEAAPFSLLSFDDAKRHAVQIVRVTRKRYMPPWMPAARHGDFVGERRLSDAQIGVLAKWADSGTPEGDLAALPKPPAFVASWQLGEPDLILRMRRPYLLAAGQGDVFRNFVLPVELSDTKYIRAMELRPGNKRVVHHANLIVDRARMLRRRDGADGEPGFAGMEVETEASGAFDPDSHFLFWKPGTTPLEESADMAWRLDPGSDLIVNLHLQPSGKPETIEAMVGLYFAKQPPSRFPMLLQLEHDGAIDIPAGSHFTIADHLKLPTAVRLLAIYPHAHYLGKQIEAWANLPNGQRRSLLRIDDWDINWQATFTYKEPVALPAGSVVSMSITYDNTGANPRNPNHPPKRVRSGNRSDDEMGHVWLQVLPATAEARVPLQQALMRRRIEKYPSDFVAHFNLGAAYQAAGKDEEAAPYLRKAVELRPANATAHNSYATSLLAMDRIDEALVELRESLRLDPAYQNARFNLARALAGKGDAKGALSEFRIYLATDPGDARAQELTGGLYASLGQFAESLPYLRKAAELEPGNAESQTNLGAALAMSGDFAAAIEAFETALKADPSSQVAQQNLERARASLKGR